MGVRTAVIGDTHGRADWKIIIAQAQWDRIVFLGDYFDTHEGISGEQQCENFVDIVAYKRDNPKRVTLLIGNHDFHYLPQAGDACYSGFQPAYARSIQHLLVKAKGELELAIEVEGWICTHAGVTEPWARQHGIGTASVETLVEDLNLAWMDRPEVFRFYRGDYSGYGDHELQGPLWVRPSCLMTYPAVEQQIVGHTTQRLGVKRVGGVVLNDALGSREFVIVEKGEMEIGRF